MKPEPTGISLEQTIGVLRRRGVWVVLCVLLVGGLAYALSKHQTKKYTATAAIAFNYSPLSQQIAGLSTNIGSSNSSVLSQQDSDLELVKLGDMAAETARLLGDNLTEAKINASLSISGRGESSIVEVAATSTSPKLSAGIANTYVRQFVKEQKTSNRRFFKSALALVNNQLARLTPAQRFGADGLDLQDRAHTLSLLAELGYNNAQVAQTASIPSSPSSPKVTRNTGLGLLLGLLLGGGIAFVRERLDRRIKRPADLELAYGLPLLGVVPTSAALSRTARRKGISMSIADAEAFGLILAHLRFFNVDRTLRTLVIASAAPDEGKTTIACHLADAAARSGARVLLLEVDLRHPTIAEQLAMRAGPGLAEVLIGAAAINQATQSVDVAKLTRGEPSEHKFEVLTAGLISPPNPSELLGSQTMRSLLAHAEATYDLIVVDTPPLTAVSDAFTLLTKVDGVVIVGWPGRSRHDAVGELSKVLAGSGAPLLGVIANGAKPHGSTRYAEPSGKQSHREATPSSGPSRSDEFVPVAKA